MSEVTHESTSQYARDREHLRLLRIFHYVVGGLEIAFGSIFIIHIAMGIIFYRNPQFLDHVESPPPPPELFLLVSAMGALFLISGWTVGILTIISGRHIGRLRHRTFSLVMAGIMCLAFPFGTALGVCTILVLTRDSVRQMYEDAVAGRTLSEPGG